MPIEGGLLTIACEKIARLDVPAFIKDSELRFVAVNPAFIAFFGADLEDLLGRRAGELTDRPEDLAWEDVERRSLVFAEEHLALCFDHSGRQHCRVQIERFITEDEMPYVFGVFRERPGRVKSRGWKKEPPPSGAQMPSAMAEISRDAASQVRSAGIGNGAAGACLPADYAMLLDLIPLGVLLLDPQLDIVYFNTSFSRMLGETTIELKFGMNFQAVLDVIGRAGWDGSDEDISGQLLAASIDEPEPCQIAMPNGRVISARGNRLENGQFLLLYTDVTEAQTYERESILYRAALENVPEPVFLRDGDRRLVFANAAYEQMLGGDRTRFYGLREDEMFPAEGEALRQENLEVLETGCATEREQLIIMPNGDTVPLLTSLKRIETKDGAPYIVGTLADVSLLKIGERQLREAKAHAEKLYDDIEAILRTMPVGVIILDADQSLSFSNLMARNMVNWPEDQAMTGTSFADYLRHAHANGWPLKTGDDASPTPDSPNPDSIDPESRIAAYSLELRTLTAARQTEVTLSDRRHIVVTASPLDDGQIMLTFSDYTEQRLREREIDEARARLQDVGKLLEEATQHMAQGLCVIQTDRILYRNDKLAEILNVSPHLVRTGADWRQLFDYCAERGDFGDNPTAFLDRMRSRLSVDTSASVVVQRRDGAWRSIEAIVSAEDRWLFVISDASEAKQREVELTTLAAQAEAADKAKSRFLANMSHEIRTPMSGVLGMTELLLSSNLDARQKTFVDVIVKSGRSLLTIINDIIDFSKIDDGSLSLRSAPFDPLAAVEDVVTLMAGRAAEKDVDILVRGQGALTHMLAGDAGRFRQILTNLLGEAIRATDRGHVLVDLGLRQEEPDLDVTLQSHGNPISETNAEESDRARAWLVLRIEDTGHGMTPEQCLMAFTKFSQMNDGALHHRDGAGLGFSIAGGLVHLFGGTIGVESAPGRGATVTVNLPFAMAAEKLPSLAGFQLRGARVLGFESNDISCGILNDQLCRWGFDGVAVNDPALALAVLEQAESQRSPIEVVVIDCCRRSGGGLDLVRKIRGDQRFDPLSIILLAADAPFNLDRMADGLNIQAQLTKPVGENLLRNVVIDVLRGARRGAVSSPRAEPEAEAPLISDAEQADLMPSSVMRQEQIDLLVLDAGEAERHFFHQALQVLGVGHACVEGESEALDLWRQWQPGMMLIDLVEDRARVLDMVRQIRAEESQQSQTAPTVLIGLAGDLSTYDKAACHKAGLDDLVLKPVSPDRLQDCIAYWLGAAAQTQPQTLAEDLGARLTAL
ncbi:PAS-domain containing protein [Agrobacterium vitis]|uniref:PAS-domain containing protein n=1 Tax=Agrobacterium vitis TaxID=373 RepID=UPI0015723145|nr:PAS-domain containing protein [Agrobacterium vitis]NSZ17542.1 PAS domain-containing protein [Agrobacterium vitis]QZO03237.1 PAS-domain containing protein [Agrobacterium vitis]UJL88357.1 PAS-domain containing protein [Agrobacterium vitis]